MKILICDNNSHDISDIKNKCKAYLETRCIEATLSFTTKPESIKEFRPDILLLSINMPKTNGIEIKDKLQLTDICPLIIYVTHNTVIAEGCFGHKVIGYLHKPVDESKLQLILDTAISLLPHDFMIHINSTKRISSSNLVYITVESNYSYLHFNDNTQSNSLRKPLKAWENELSSFGFMRISDSFIVNCKYIDEIVNDNIFLDNGLGTLKICKRRNSKCKNLYVQYCKRMAKFL